MKNRPINPFRLTSLAGILIAGYMIPATAQESLIVPPFYNAEKGAELASMWCSSCHVTGADATESAVDTAPPFSTLAPMAIANPAAVRTFLAVPHSDPMRGITLSREEIDSLVAFIQQAGVEE